MVLGANPIFDDKDLSKYWGGLCGAANYQYYSLITLPVQTEQIIEHKTLFYSFRLLLCVFGFEFRV